MSKLIFIAGAGDPAGIRMVKDFQKMGYTVAAAVMPETDATSIGAEIVLTIDPLSQDSAKSAAAEMEKLWGKVDLLAVNIDGTPEDDPKTILDKPDYTALKWAYEYNALGALRIIDAFMPLLQKGEGRRICVVTTLDSSNNYTRGNDNFARHISKAPLNMALNQLFNKYRPDGFTFRVYCKDTNAGPEKAGEFAAEYFIRNRSNEPESYKHSDENRMVMRDWMGIEVPW